jgi:hypothetical protein
MFCKCLLIIFVRPAYDFALLSDDGKWSVYNLRAHLCVCACVNLCKRLCICVFAGNYEIAGWTPLYYIWMFKCASGYKIFGYTNCNLFWSYVNSFLLFCGNPALFLAWYMACKSMLAHILGVSNILPCLRPLLLSLHGASAQITLVRNTAERILSSRTSAWTQFDVSVTMGYSS